MLPSHSSVAGELTRKAIHDQPEWLRGVPERVGERRLPAGRVVYTGCGTSFHAAQTGGHALQALEAVLSPPDADVLVCVSHEGGTRLTIEAADAFAGPVWLVTGKEKSPLAEVADVVIVANVNINFRSRATLGEPLEIGARTSRIGTKSFDLDHEVQGPDGRLVAAASTTLVAIDYRADKTIPVPREWRERIEDYEARSFATT